MKRKLARLQPRVGTLDMGRAAPLPPRDRKNPVEGFSYDSARWRKLSIAYRRAHPACEHCEAEGRFSPADHVDHRIAIAKGGDPWAWDNLCGLCRTCHSRKTAHEDGSFGREPGEPRRTGCDADGVPLDPRHHWR